MKAILLFLLAVLYVATINASGECLETFQCFSDNCAGIEDGCALASCGEACAGEKCKDYCEQRGCPPGNSKESCLVDCGVDGEGSYHLCSDASGLTAAVLALAFF